MSISTPSSAPISTPFCWKKPLVFDANVTMINYNNNNTSASSSLFSIHETQVLTLISKCPSSFQVLKQNFISLSDQKLKNIIDSLLSKNKIEKQEGINPIRYKSKLLPSKIEISSVEENGIKKERIKEHAEKIRLHLLQTIKPKKDFNPFYIRIDFLSQNVGLTPGDCRTALFYLTQQPNPFVTKKEKEGWLMIRLPIETTINVINENKNENLIPPPQPLPFQEQQQQPFEEEQGQKESNTTEIKISSSIVTESVHVNPFSLSPGFHSLSPTASIPEDGEQSLLGSGNSSPGSSIITVPSVSLFPPPEPKDWIDDVLKELARLKVVGSKRQNNPISVRMLSYKLNLDMKSCLQLLHCLKELGYVDHQDYNLWVPMITMQDYKMYLNYNLIMKLPLHYSHMDKTVLFYQNDDLFCLYHLLLGYEQDGLINKIPHLNDLRFFQSSLPELLEMRKNFRNNCLFTYRHAVEECKKLLVYYGLTNSTLSDIQNSTLDLYFNEQIIQQALQECIIFT